MRKTLVVLTLGLVAVALCLMPMASYAKTSYFGVPNKALAYPKDFDETEAAIAKAEQSPGAKSCPEKLAKAKELAKQGVLAYWACHTEEGLALLAQARQMAKEAELCRTVVLTGGVHFAFDSSELTSEGRAVLDQQIPSLKANPNMKVNLAGHTCSLGSEAYNQALSERRAKSVYDYLVANGIAAERLTMTGYGETRPAFSNDTEEGRSQNRRVELIIK
ncbi:MAG: OmpA family protein [Deltaproteobacteria bacterium]|nr:OmpA family protein [Deltaproteobacteria bacterium]